MKIINKESLPSLPLGLKVSGAFWKDEYVVLVAETNEAYFEFIWDGVSVDWSSTRAFPKVDFI